MNEQNIMRGPTKRRYRQSDGIT